MGHREWKVVHYLVVWMVAVIIQTHASVTCATCLMRRVVKLQRKSRKARGQGG